MSKTMTREVWNDLRYPVSLRQMPEDEGGYWLASIPLLGEGQFIADGETPQEALDSLEERRLRFYAVVVSSGKPIPLPSDVAETVEALSGKWLQRTSPSFHAELKEAARKNNVSLNEYCNQCLQRGHAVQSMCSAAEHVFASVAEQMVANLALSTQQVPDKEGDAPLINSRIKPQGKDHYGTGKLTGKLRGAHREVGKSG
jgi:antitoxin HicB